MAPMPAAAVAIEPHPDLPLRGGQVKVENEASGMITTRGFVEGTLVPLLDLAAGGMGQ